MKLRSQMLLAGALTLAVPMVGWQSVKQLYSALQQTRIDEQTLKVANMRLALSEAEPVNSVLAKSQLTTGAHDWYAPTSPYPIFIDGYADDWRELPGDDVRYTLASDSTWPSDSLAVSVRTARVAESLFVFVKVFDDQVRYHIPPRLIADAGEGELPDFQARLVNGDSLELLVQNVKERWQHGLFRAIAPGPVVALRGSDQYANSVRVNSAGQALADWRGAWVTSANGYHVELQLPLPPFGSVVGLAVVDVDEEGQSRTVWAGNLSPLTMQHVGVGKSDTADIQAGLLFYDNPVAQEYLQRWTTAGVRARLFDVHGRLLADVNNLYAKAGRPDDDDAAGYSSVGLWDALLLRVFAFFVAGDLPLLPETRNVPVMLNLDADRRAVLHGDTPSTSRYVTDENDRVLGTLAPIGSDPRRGYLLFEANEEHASAYAGSQLARLFSLLLLVSLVAGSGLLIFAFVLSSRIRTLSRQAQSAIADDGRVQGLPGSDANDEIGDLSRKLSSLLSRSAAYTHYLEALASRLSHELRTPLSVVRTSIENLDRDALDDQSRQLVDRASGGAEHLGSIIKALVESTRLEQTVQLADREVVNLRDWLAGCMARYGQVYPDRGFRISPEPVPAVFIKVSPELLQQAFDKLVDNAVSFATADPIVFHLQLENNADARQVRIGVANRGATLDPAIMEQWFEPLYSERQNDRQNDRGAAGGALSVQDIRSTADAGADQPLHLGLGLYVVKMIAQAHGGSTYAQNQVAPDHHNWVHVGLRLHHT